MHSARPKRPGEAPSHPQTKHCPGPTSLQRPGTRETATKPPESRERACPTYYHARPRAALWEIGSLPIELGGGARQKAQAPWRPPGGRGYGERGARRRSGETASRPACGGTWPPGAKLSRPCPNPTPRPPAACSAAGREAAGRAPGPRRGQGAGWSVTAGRART